MNVYPCTKVAKHVRCWLQNLFPVEITFYKYLCNIHSFCPRVAVSESLTQQKNKTIADELFKMQLLNLQKSLVAQNPSKNCPTHIQFAPTTSGAQTTLEKDFPKIL